MQRVSDTRQLAIRVMFWMSVLVTGHVFAALAMLAGEILEHSGTYLIGLSVCAAVFWIAYFLQRMQTVDGSHSIHATAFLCLSLITFIGLFNPYLST
jgi:low affinity Fe/Cu permease